MAARSGNWRNADVIPATSADIRDQHWLDDQIAAIDNGIEAVLDIARNWTENRNLSRLHPGVSAQEYILSNAKHPLGRGVVVPLLEGSDWSNRQIASVAGVGTRTVDRAAVHIATAPDGAVARPDRTLGADGKLRRARAVRAVTVEVIESEEPEPKTEFGIPQSIVLKLMSEAERFYSQAVSPGPGHPGISRSEVIAEIAANRDAVELQGSGGPLADQLAANLDRLALDSTRFAFLLREGATNAPRVEAPVGDGSADSSGEVSPSADHEAGKHHNKDIEGCALCDAYWELTDEEQEAVDRAELAAERKAERAAAKVRAAWIAKNPEAIAWRCAACEAEFTDGDADAGQGTLLECGECGTRFTYQAEGSNRCPDCNRFAAKVADLACPECEAGGLEEVNEGDVRESESQSDTVVAAAGSTEPTEPN
jgi:DNA-directed RNA polymerase subunit RPC12/RpoP